MHLSTRALAVAAALLAAALPRVARAEESAAPQVLEPGRFRIAGAGGVSEVDREWTYAEELSARAGIARGVEIAGPLALGAALIDVGNGSGLVLGGGIVDIWISEGGDVFWCPAVALAGRFRTSTTSSLRASADITGAERDLAEGEHPAWFRGSLALLIDIGPYATIAAGASYQRRLAGQEDAPEAHRLGWAGDARVSILSVRTEPFEELPTLAVHVTEVLDIIALVRVDIDMDSRTTDARYLVGARIDLNTRLTGTAF